VADTPARKKRLVKNPESFRERATKAMESADQPRQHSRFWRPIGHVLAAGFRPIGRGLKIVFNTKPFKLVGKLLRPLGKVLLIPYFRSSWQELKQVTWPNWRQSRSLTFAVLLFAIVFGAAIAGVDYGLDKLFRNILLK
jgi:preprotein translocase SecE subunit